MIKTASETGKTFKTIIIATLLAFSNAGLLSLPSLAEAQTARSLMAQSPKIEKSPLTAKDAITAALVALEADNVAGAIAVLKQALSAFPATPVPAQQAEIIELESALAAVAVASSDFKMAAGNLQQILNQMDKVTDQQGLRYKTLQQVRLGEVFFSDYKLDKALEQFQAALQQSDKLGESTAFADPVRRDALDGLSRTLMAQKNMVEAEKYCLSLLQTCQHTGQPALEDALYESWAYMNLADVYRALKDAEKEAGAKKMAVASFKALLQQQVLLSQKEVVLGIGDIADHMGKATTFPGLVSESLWQRVRLTSKSLPVLIWRDPRVQPWATVLCVHGLGLSNHSFEEFGKALAPMGVTVCALDVRGFGAWGLSSGMVGVDFEACIDDVKNMLVTIKQALPGRVFLLGESMGGAIVLQVAGRYPELMDGLVSACPGARRYEAMKTARKVARNFVRGPKKPFDIGTQIVDQATNDASLQKKWKSDPKSKLDLSPVDLMKFDVFMRETNGYARKIDNVPVVMLQGLKDELVRPESTFKLFRSLKSPDRTMMVYGNCEHIMIEEGEFSDVILFQLVDWFKTHGKAAPRQNPDSDSLSHR